MTRLRICLIAASKFPVAEPFAGGLEAHTHALARHLIARGHEVTLFAAPGSDPSLGAQLLEVDEFTPSEVARQDIGAKPDEWMREHHAYLSLMLDLMNEGQQRFDVVHNNSLHHLPVAMASTLGVPLVTTLHTPPTPWLESAARLATTVDYIAVSAHPARQWEHVCQPRVLLNGVDTSVWRPGPGGGDAIWFGRVVPEKGPHHAIAAAGRAGIPLDIAGPCFDRAYFEAEIAPWLDDSIRYVGHLSQGDLAERVGRASVSVITPCWDEPYGLVAAESLACGTPVAGYDRGASAEIVTPECGRLVPHGDTDALARAMLEAREIDRAAAVDRARTACSIETMVDAYERRYRELIEPVAA